MSIEKILKDTLNPGLETETLNFDANLQQSEQLQDSHPAILPISKGDLARPKEFGGRPGADPTRYGDWEKNGRCIDF